MKGEFIMKKMSVWRVCIMVALIASLVACGVDQNDTEKNPDDTINLKSASIQGDWVYHFKRDVSEAGATPGLYKTKLDNSETERISEDLGLFLIVDGEWIYYSNIPFEQNEMGAIYKVKIDGTEKTKLVDDSIMASMAGKGFELDGDWLYYLSLNEEGSLYRVHIEGGDREKLSEGYGFHLKGDWIYYNTFESGPRINRMKKDGSDDSVVFEEAAILLDVSDEHIYYSDESGNNLKKITLDGSAVEELNIDNVYLFQAIEDELYYVTQPAIPEPDNQLYRAKMDGSGITKLSDDDSFFMEVAGGWIYYISMDEASYSFKLNKMKKDGSDKETFKAEGIFIFLNW